MGVESPLGENMDKIKHLVKPNVDSSKSEPDRSTICTRVEFVHTGHIDNVSDIFSSPYISD